MKKLTSLFTLPVLLLLLFTACKKIDNTPPTTPTTPPVTAPPADTTVKSNPAGRILALGTGSGDLVIDGTTLGVKCSDVIKVKGGVYTSIIVKNINVGCTVTIQNDGLVEIAGSNDHMVFTNVSNLTVSGAGTASISRGFVSRDNAQHRSIIINGAVHDVTFQNFSFKNIGDYVVYMNNSALVYNSASATTYTNNLKFLNIDCDNTATFLQMDGGVVNGVVTGVVKNLEIAYLNFKNSNCGNIIFVGNADDYNIHHNTVNAINQTNNNHNGIFTIKGSGSFHHNLVTNHQGNAIRAWARSLGTTPKEVLIYNNTVVNSRKYSAFEAQSFEDEISAGKTTFANVKVYNNICGDLNLSKDWVGVIVDVYSLVGGKIDVYNNTGFDFPAPNPTSFIENVQSTTTPTLTNNVYYPTAQAAGINTSSLAIQTQ